eukprot:6770363-Prymnesium_polylepis.1
MVEGEARNAVLFRPHEQPQLRAVEGDGIELRAAHENELVVDLVEPVRVAHGNGTDCTPVQHGFQLEALLVARVDLDVSPQPLESLARRVAERLECKLASHAHRVEHGVCRPAPPQDRPRARSRRPRRPVRAPHRPGRTCARPRRQASRRRCRAPPPTGAPSPTARSRAPWGGQISFSRCCRPTPRPCRSPSGSDERCPRMPARCCGRGTARQTRLPARACVLTLTQKSWVKERC